MSRSAKRTKRRMACALVVGRQRFSGVVLDFSSTGIFVQTTAKPQPREAVTLELSLPGRREPIRLEASVARLFMVPAQLLTVAQGGIGLRIRNAPEAYFELLQRIQLERKPAGKETAAGAGDCGFSRPAGRPYRVRMTQLGRARTRTLRVVAGSPEEAASAAIAEVGEGWKMLESCEDEGPAPAD